MKNGIAGAAGLAAALVLATSALAQMQPPPAAAPANCPKPGAPSKVEGQVIKVDPNQSMITVRTPEGQTQEFRAAPETVQGMKIGDKVEANLRVPPECKRG